jgi:hypothetical protein
MLFLGTLLIGSVVFLIVVRTSVSESGKRTVDVSGNAACLAREAQLTDQVDRLEADKARLIREGGSLLDANQEADALVSLLLGQVIATQNAGRSSDDRVTVLTVCALNGALSLVFGESDCGQELDEVHEVFRVYDVDYSGTGAAMLLKRTDDI